VMLPACNGEKDGQHQDDTQIDRANYGSTPLVNSVGERSLTPAATTGSSS
jgi:hypothetical protein